MMPNTLRPPRLNPHPERLKVGDRVTSDYSMHTAGRTFKVEAIIDYPHCDSGRLVKVRGVTPELDASWWRPAGKEEATPDG